jgi:uridine phosphorylase
MSKNSELKKSNYTNANLPIDDQGRVYHVGVKFGQVANRIITVGDPNRAIKLSHLLDKICFEYKSDRGFYTFTGLKNNVPITIMSIGMGMPMMDFMIRESVIVVKGALCIIRIGTCGTPNDDVKIGTVTIAQDSLCIQTNFENFHGDNTEGEYYKFSPSISANEDLVNNLKLNLDEQGVETVSGLDVTTDSFYSSQGRRGEFFNDHNQDLITTIMRKYPSTISIQM